MPDVLDIRTAHYPENGKYSFLNFALKFWIKRRIAEYEKAGNTDKVARYKKMNSDNMMMEPPTVFKSNYAVVNVLDRVGGLLALDQKVNLVKFEDFVTGANKSTKVDGSAKTSSPFTDIISDETDWGALVEKLKEVESLSSTPIYWLTKDKSDGSYQVIYEGDEDGEDFNLMVEWVFNGYSFEYIELVEENIPTQYENSSQASSGSVTVTDRMLVGKKITMNFVNLNAIKKLMV